MKFLYINLNKPAVIFNIITALTLFPLICFSEEAKEGEAAYKLHCVPCHGIKGEGNGPKAEELKISPQDHTNSAYMSTRTDKLLERVIREGGISIAKAPQMPPWDDILSDSQIYSLIKYIRKLCDCSFNSIISDPKLSKVDAEFR